MGFLYEYGKDGVKQDYKEALRWYRLAAEQGDAGAQTNLGVLYSNGLGVTKDYVQALKWWSIAGENGQDVARKNKDLVKMLMTPAQIAEAQKLAREWMEEHGKK